jgi:ComF family protein
MLCDACYEDAARVKEPYCERCGESYDGVIGSGFVCPNCDGLDYAFDFAFSALLNTVPNHQLVVDFKYRGRRGLSRELACFCDEVLREHPRFSQLPDPVLVPVPLHWRKQWQRGFNQAELLAQQLSTLGFAPSLSLLKRTRYTETQTKLSRAQRAENLKGAFVARELPEQFRSVILLDDVFTTGATAHACALAVKKHAPEVENVVVLTALRG